MDSNHRNSSPVLLPLWHSTTKHLCSKCDFDIKWVPDYGGAGANVHNVPQLDTRKSSEKMKVCFLKSEVPLEGIYSKNCILPLNHPTSLENLLDPFSQNLRHLQSKQKQYCLRLFRLGHFLSKHRRKQYLSLLKELANEKIREQFIVPLALVEMAESMPYMLPVPKANWKYLGGCLGSVSCSGINDNNPLLIHSGGTHLNDIVMTSVDRKSNDEEKFVASTKWKFKLDGSPIYQVSVQSFDQNIVGCIRQEENYHIMSGQVEDISVNNIFNVKSEKISYCSVSPHIMGEYIVLTPSGHLILKNGDNKCVTWKSLLQDDDLNFQRTCGFGSHPRYISYCTHRALSIVDVRTKESRCLEIFNNSSPFLFRDEELSFSKVNVARPFEHFIATNHHMVLCDERFSQQPFSSWNHLMDSCPLYCDIFESDIDDISKIHILLGAHLPQQVVYFSLMPSLHPQVQPISCMPPLHLSVPTDIIEYLKLKCVALEDPTIRHLSAPITGACSSAYSQGYIFFQLTSFGDLFYQNYLKSDDIGEKTCSIGPGCSTELPFSMSDMDWWMKEANYFATNSPDSLSLEPLRQIDCQSEFESTVSLPTSSKDCVFCCNSNDDNASLENCISCGIDTKVGKNIFKAAKLHAVIPNAISEISDSDEYSALIKKEFYYESMDPFSKSVYDSWFDGDLNKSARLSLTPNGTYNEFTAVKTPILSSVDVSNNFTSDSLLSKISIDIFNDMEDEIPPSQETPLLVGETVRGLSKRKRKNLSSAEGF